MPDYQHIKDFAESMGVDLRTNDILRPYPFATESTNTISSPQGSIRTRPGSQIKAKTYGKFGIVRFDSTDMLGNIKSEIIGFGADSITNSAVPYRLVKTTFNISNEHPTEIGTVGMFYSEADGEFKFTATVDGVTEVSQLLGIGTEASPYMLSSLVTLVNDSTHFTMSNPTNASSIPAAFMEIIGSEEIAADVDSPGYLYVNAYYWEQINSPHSTSNVYATLKNAALEIGGNGYVNVSAVPLSNVLYISAGSNLTATFQGGSSIPTASLCKYDGQNFYRAGMPNVTQDISFTDVSTGTKTDAKGAFSRSGFAYNDNQYQITLKQVDKAGNIIEGDIDRGTSAVVIPGAGTLLIDVTLPSLSLSTKGFNTGFAASTSDQSSTLAINVDDGASGTHTLHVGDVAYFWDSAQSRFIQREITAKSSSTITLSTNSLDTDSLSPNYDTGGNVSVKNNAAFSNNLRLVIWRYKTSDPTYYVVEEIPYCELYSHYYDSNEDSTLGAEYIQPTWKPGLPPQGRFLCSFNDQLIVSGNDLRPNTIFFSDQVPEVFPEGTFEFDLTAAVTGIHQNGPVLACGTRNTIDIVDGDLRNFNFVVTRISNSVGFTSHGSLQDIDEGILFFQSAKGPQSLNNGRSLQPLGAVPSSSGIPMSRIEPFFTQIYNSTDIQPIFKRSTSGVIKDLNLYFLFVPFEDPAKPGFATSSSVLWVYDYSRDSWRKWTGLNASGGIVELDNAIFFASRSHDGAAGIDFDNASTNFYQQQILKGQYNYADHDAYIDVKHQYHWEAFGEPSIYKRFGALNVLSLETRDSDSMPITVKTYLDYDNTKISVSDTLTFASDKSLKMKLKPERCKSLMVSLESQQYYKPLLISGIELEAVAPYRPIFKG